MTQPVQILRSSGSSAPASLAAGQLAYVEGLNALFVGLIGGGVRQMAPSTVIPVNSQTGTAYTAVASDAGKEIRMANAAANTLTIDPSLYTAGTRIFVTQWQSGQTTIAVSVSGAIYKPPGTTAKLHGQYSSAVITVVTSAVILIGGDLEAA